MSLMATMNFLEPNVCSLRALTTVDFVGRFSGDDSRWEGQKEGIGNACIMTFMLTSGRLPKLKGNRIHLFIASFFSSATKLARL
jgi:hypothetical protein